MDTGLQIREHRRRPGRPLISRRPDFCLALGVLFCNSNGNAPIPMRMLWWVKDTPRPRESCPRSPVSQNIKAEHERDPTYLVSSMLSDEASPELGLELAAGTRSGTQEPHGGPAGGISGSGCRHPLTSSWALLGHPNTAVLPHPSSSSYLSPSLLRPQLSM